MTQIELPFAQPLAPPPTLLATLSPEALSDEPTAETAAPAPASAPASAPATLADLFVFYHDANSLHPRRANIRSSIKTVGRGIGRPLDLVPADPPGFRAALEEGSAGKAGVKPRAWIAAKCTVNGALRDAGVALRPSRDTTVISASWQALLDAAPDPVSVAGLTRITRYLTRTEVTPDAVTPEHFAAYREEMFEQCAKANPANSYRQMLNAWRRAEKAIPNWPRVEVERKANPNHYTLPWEDFPPSLKAEIDRFLHTRLKADPLDENPVPAMRPATGKGRLQNLKVMATALVLSKTLEIEAITSLSVLTEPKHVRAAVRYLRDNRFDGEHRPHLLHFPELAKTIARHWEQDEDKARNMNPILKAIGDEIGDKGGITSKNRDRLAQFDNPKNVKRLLELPQRTLKAVADKPKTCTSAVRMMYALQVQILLIVPLRVHNLTGIKLGENLLETGSGKTRQIKLFFRREDTKTHTDFIACLPARIYPLIDAWLNEWRPLISDTPSPYLFPNPKGVLRSKEALSIKVSKFVARETGLKMNPHLFRHLAAKLYLTFDPNGIEIVRQLLGHKSIKTTLKAYAELQTEPAFRRLEEALLDIYDRPSTGRSQKK